MSDQMIEIDGRPFPVWPAGQELRWVGHKTLYFTEFADAAEFGPGLAAGMLAREQAEGATRRYFKGACGTKLHHVHEWDFPEARLIHARALEMAKRVLRWGEVHVDLCWGNLYRNGDYCMPHSHLRTAASIVYFLDAGELDADDSVAGRFYFCDPRLDCCCQDQPGAMTTPFVPDMVPGTMMMFPSVTVHGVNPYHGHAPRMTLSWNLNSAKVAGRALPD